MFNRPGPTYTLLDFSQWLQHESWCQDLDGQSAAKGTKEKQAPKQEGHQGKRFVMVLHGAKEKEDVLGQGSSTKKKGKAKPYSLFCDNAEHYLSQCTAVTKLSEERLKEWIQTNRRCWRCARPHQAAQCNLKKPCSLCQGKHLQVLHEVNVRAPEETAKPPNGESCLMNSTAEMLYVDSPAEGNLVLLKVIRVLLQHGDRTLETYAILDDGLSAPCSFQWPHET